MLNLQTKNIIFVARKHNFGRSNVVDFRQAKIPLSLKEKNGSAMKFPLVRKQKEKIAIQTKNDCQ